MEFENFFVFGSYQRQTPHILNIESIILIKILANLIHAILIINFILRDENIAKRGDTVDYIVNIRVRTLKNEKFVKR